MVAYLSATAPAPFASVRPSSQNIRVASVVPHIQLEWWKAFISLPLLLPSLADFRFLFITLACRRTSM